MTDPARAAGQQLLEWRFSSSAAERPVFTADIVYMNIEE